MICSLEPDLNSVRSLIGWTKNAADAADILLISFPTHAEGSKICLSSAHWVERCVSKMLNDIAPDQYIFVSSRAIGLFNVPVQLKATTNSNLGYPAHRKTKTGLKLRARESGLSAFGRNDFGLSHGISDAPALSGHEYGCNQIRELYIEQFQLYRDLEDEFQSSPRDRGRNFARRAYSRGVDRLISLQRYFPIPTVAGPWRHAATT